MTDCHWPFSALHIADFDGDRTTALGGSRRANPINSDTAVPSDLSKYN
jgi:hypothetical protein